MSAKKKRQPAPVLSAAQCVAALRKHFDPKAYALLEQVANGTGWKANRWADAVVMSLWPSRGLTLVGVEVKVSRGDWTRELKDPEKSADIQGYCDHWWICAPVGLVDTLELPPTWGLLEVDEKLRVHVAAPAPQLEAKNIDRAMLAAILRRSAECQDALLRRAHNEGREKGALDGAGELARRLSQAEEQLKHERSRADEFRKISGVDLNAWNLGDVAAAVKVIASGGVKDLDAELARNAERFRDIAADMDRKRAALKKSGGLG